MNTALKEMRNLKENKEHLIREDLIMAQLTDGVCKGQKKLALRYNGRSSLDRGNSNRKWQH